MEGLHKHARYLSWDGVFLCANMGEMNVAKPLSPKVMHGPLLTSPVQYVTILYK